MNSFKLCTTSSTTNGQDAVFTTTNNDADKTPKPLVNLPILTKLPRLPRPVLQAPSVMPVVAQQSPTLLPNAYTLGVELGLPPLAHVPNPQFLPQPVEHYAWREDRSYTDRSGYQWLLPNHPKYADWVNQEFIKYFDVASVSSVSPAPAADSNPDRAPLFPYQLFISKLFCPSSPYRGVLVNHDMGSGKSRTGVETAENFRMAGYSMIVLLPASLRDNMIGEIRKWGRPDLSYPPGFALLSEAEQTAITNELNRRIRSQYHFVSYNSSRVVQELKKLDLRNACILIDEIHDLINMMTTESGKVGKLIYHMLMEPRNLRVIGLTGTINPINYPYELGLLFNLIRGPIPVYREGQIVDWSTAYPETREAFDDLFADYDTQKLRNLDLMKRRATGLVSYFHGASEDLYPDVIHMDIERIEMDDQQFEAYWKARLEEIVRESRKGSGKRVAPNTFRPNSRQFCNYALPPGINRPMSLGKYKRLIFDNPRLSALQSEWTREQVAELRDLSETLVMAEGSTQGESQNPNTHTPKYQAAVEAYEKYFRRKWASYSDPKARLAYLVGLLQSVGAVGRYQHIISANEEEAILNPSTNNNGVDVALSQLSSDRFNNYLDPKQDLAKCSRKHLRIHENLAEGLGNDGPAFLFSNFRTLEGVEIFSRELDVIGWTRYSEADDLTVPKLRYAIVSGTEAQDLRTRIIDYYNHPRNIDGSYLKLILGTSSSAQGLSLMNCRQVHIMEPWWTLTLIHQVIGRARRIRSHHALPKEMRKVYVYQYHSVLSEEQKARVPNPKEHKTTDEYLYEKAVEKDAINQQCYDLVKEVAIDFTLSARDNRPLDKGLRAVPARRSGEHTFMPRIEQEAIQVTDDSPQEMEKTLRNREVSGKNSTYRIVRKTLKWAGITVGKKRFAVVLDNNGRPQREPVLWLGEKRADQAIVLYDEGSLRHGGTLVVRCYVDSKGKRRETTERAEPH